MIAWVALIIFVANIVRENTDEIKTFIGNTGIDIVDPIGFSILSLIAFTFSWLLGSSSRFGAITVILSSIYGVAYLPWFFAVDFAGYIMSPMHKCVAIGKMYFGTKISYYFKIISIWVALLITTAGILLYA